MSGRSAKLAALLSLALCCAPSAFARTQNFFTGTPLGLGFKAGLEKSPRTDFLVDPQKVDGTYGKFFAFEPFLDFGNFILRVSGALHNYPLFSADGNDASGAFSETSDASSFAYGLQLLLVPYYSENFLHRTYIVLGGSNVSTSLKNSRTYAASSATYTEKAKGSGQEYIAGAGYEFFFVQNYSVQFELGYRKYTVDKFTYGSEGDLTGKSRSQGETVVKADSGLVKKFHHESPYAAFSLNLNF